MKKMYEKPMAFEEAFVADEYVAACYFVACKRGNEEWTGNDDKWGGVYPNKDPEYFILH